LIFIAELFVLAYWGLESPGQVIATEQAVLVLGGTAILVSAVSLALFHVGRPMAQSVTRAYGASRTAAEFVLLIAGGAVGIGWSLNGAVDLIVMGASASQIYGLILSIGLLTTVILLTLFFLYRLEGKSGSLKRKIRMFEVGSK
jgi:hypothetical protein